MKRRLPFEIVYEDRDLVAIDKPAGLLSTHTRVQGRMATGRSGTPSRQSRGVDPPVQIRRGERAQRRGCWKTSGFLSRETGISGNFVGRIKGAKCPFDLQFLTWDFS